jgi:hypothetical protein
VLPLNTVHCLEKRHTVSNSNKSPTRCNNFSSLLSWHLFTAQHVSDILTPIIRSSTTAVAASAFTFVSWCWSWSGRLAQPRPTALLPPHYNGKTRGCYCSCWAPDDGRETPETCWAVNKRQVINFRNCCVQLVDLLELYDDTRTCKL